MRVASGDEGLQPFGREVIGEAPAVLAARVDHGAAEPQRRDPHCIGRGRGLFREEDADQSTVRGGSGPLQGLVRESGPDRDLHEIDAGPGHCVDARDEIRIVLGFAGNRVPQFAFEVLRPVGGIAQTIRAVCLIPGSTEFGLDPRPVTEDAGFGTTKPANRFQLQAGSDVLASLDTLQALCPRLARVSVIVSWFGDDLRAGECRIAPRVDSTGKAVIGEDWEVAGLIRGEAQAVSLSNGAPAYGGTPSDAGLLRLIAELRRRGLEVVLYPFVMMDVPAGNALPDPRRPGATQPAYPWRGRITCDPAPGLAGTSDATAAADAQVAAFFANGYRAFIAHYAQLCVTAGLSGFILGSEFVGLTRVRGASGYPAVAALRSLAQEVRALLGPAVRLVYAADWTEYGADVRGSGASGKVKWNTAPPSSALVAQIRPP